MRRKQNYSILHESKFFSFLILRKTSGKKNSIKYSFNKQLVSFLVLRKTLLITCLYCFSLVNLCQLLSAYIALMFNHFNLLSWPPGINQINFRKVMPVRQPKFARSSSLFQVVARPHFDTLQTKLSCNSKTVPQ